MHRCGMVLDGTVTNMSKALGSQQLEIVVYDPTPRHSCVVGKFLPINSLVLDRKGR